MPATIKKVKWLDEYRLRLTFGNGETGDVDLRDLITGRGGVFKQLENLSYFRKVRINPDFESIEWPNGADFCPDVLYAKATGKPIPMGEPDELALAPRKRSA